MFLVSPSPSFIRDYRRLPGRYEYVRNPNLAKVCYSDDGGYQFSAQNRVDGIYAAGITPAHGFLVDSGTGFWEYIYLIPDPSCIWTHLKIVRQILFNETNLAFQVSPWLKYPDWPKLFNLYWIFMDKVGLDKTQRTALRQMQRSRLLSNRLKRLFRQLTS